MSEAPTKRFVYHGPPVFAVAIGRQLDDGDELEGPANLASSAGFTELEAPKFSSPKDQGGDS